MVGMVSDDLFQNGANACLDIFDGSRSFGKDGRIGAEAKRIVSLTQDESRQNGRATARGQHRRPPREPCGLPEERHAAAAPTGEIEVGQKNYELVPLQAGRDGDRGVIHRQWADATPDALRPEQALESYGRLLQGRPR